MKHGKILVAEKDPFVREVYYKFFAKKGHHVVMVQHEDELLTQIKRNDRPRLLLLDSDLPSSGWQTFVRDIRKEVGDAIKIVLLAESVEEQTSLRGVEAFINKQSHSLEGLYKMAEKYVTETE